jgi:uncharacterized membrane protein YccC
MMGFKKKNSKPGWLVTTALMAGGAMLGMAWEKRT